MLNLRTLAKKKSSKFGRGLYRVSRLYRNRTLAIYTDLIVASSARKDFRLGRYSATIISLYNDSDSNCRPDNLLALLFISLYSGCHISY